MSRVEVRIGEAEPMTPHVITATPLGLLATEAEVQLRAVVLRGRAAALRRLAAVLVEAAELAELADADDRRGGGR